MALPIAAIIKGAEVAGSAIDKAKSANDKAKDEAEGKNKKEAVKSEAIDKVEDKLGEDKESESTAADAKIKDDVGEFTAMLESELPKYVVNRRY